jgi:hypothetical protein
MSEWNGAVSFVAVVSGTLPFLSIVGDVGWACVVGVLDAAAAGFR